MGDELGWIKGYREWRKQWGQIACESDRGRRYFAARVDFPPPSGWWPRTTETCSRSEARQWVDEQIADYHKHFPSEPLPAAPQSPDTAHSNDAGDRSRE